MRNVYDADIQIRCAQVDKLKRKKLKLKLKAQNLNLLRFVEVREIEGTELSL